MATRRKGRPGGYEEIAAHFRRLMDSGELSPGDPLPSMRDVCDQFGSAITTVNRAFRLLQEEGRTVSKPGVGTIVRDMSRVRVPFSTYGDVLAPGGDKGPWERATAAQGLDGRMLVEAPEEVGAPADVAARLGIEPGALVVHRRRRATIGEDVVQLQDAWYPLEIARAAGLDRPGKVVGGVLGAMTGAGLSPTSTDHDVEVWVPSAQQAAELSLGSRVSVLVVERVTYDATGRVLELTRHTGAADRLTLTYKGLPLRATGAEGSTS
ncbi:GntR family transcriptional regulator [Streptomyces sp. NRRL_B-16638]|uniref:GntR family transcriptional regulator n=1 Tax=unclassified Streptomyces TaxID=2593676 RepID=UPI0029B29526|nr:GntR family transcriptional regulator [Streptomyces sp. NRRL_B-16638]MDX2930436.1 GntR family transcriptional regulator [Streptomyces sp. NRRL_B-16638]